MQALFGELLKQRQGTLKFLLNESAIAFFPVTQQHRDLKVAGLSYEDDYRGNALAGLITLERVEIRFHAAFSDDRVKAIWTQVLKLPEVAPVQLGPLHYQGRVIA